MRISDKGLSRSCSTHGWDNSKPQRYIKRRVERIELNLLLRETKLSVLKTKLSVKKLKMKDERGQLWRTPLLMNSATKMVLFSIRLVALTEIRFYVWLIVAHSFGDKFKNLSQQIHACCALFFFAWHFGCADQAIAFLTNCEAQVIPKTFQTSVMFTDQWEYFTKLFDCIFVTYFHGLIELLLSNYD